MLTACLVKKCTHTFHQTAQIEQEMALVVDTSDVKTEFLKCGAPSMSLRFLVMEETLDRSSIFCQPWMKLVSPQNTSLCNVCLYMYMYMYAFTNV